MQLELFIPDRYDTLKREAGDKIDKIIFRVKSALDKIDKIAQDIKASRQGAFVIVKGRSGSGKTTFLHTLNLYKKDVDIATVPKAIQIEEYLSDFAPSGSKLSVIIIESREALSKVSETEIEQSLHSVNEFLRSKQGSNSLVAWVCNTDELAAKLASKGREIGGDSLVPEDSPYFEFSGPEKSQFIDIVKKTVAELNNGHSINHLGITESELENLLKDDLTIGDYIKSVRALYLQKQHTIALIDKENFQLVFIILSTEEPIGHISSLKNGPYFQVALDNLTSSTNANIVATAKKKADKLGILLSRHDVRIISIPTTIVNAIVRHYASTKLTAKLKEKKFSVTRVTNIKDLFSRSPLQKILNGQPLNANRKGKAIGSNTKDAFKKILQITETDDSIVNEAFLSAMKANYTVLSGSVEKPLGDKYKIESDVYAQLDSGKIIRLEFMWRNKATIGAIADYVLKKLVDYGKALEYLS